MKKSIVVALVCFLGLTQMSAQVTFKPGVKTGLNFSKFTNSNSDYKTDFYLGGLLSIKLAKFYTLQPELVYSRQGAIRTEYNNLSQYDPIVSTSRREVKYSLDYLSLGIINKFNFAEGFHVVVGPSLDFKVADNFKYNNSSNPIEFDFALIGGLGYTFPNGLTIDGRVKQGMVDIFGNNYNTTYYSSNDNGNNNSNSNGNIDEVVLNQLFQLGVSYSFDLK
jgi:hypothetical protein